MITLSGGWLDAAKVRTQIEGVPEAAALLPAIDGAHRRVLKTQAKPNKGSAELVAIQEEQAELDGTHDRSARGTYGALTAFADLTADPDEAARYLALRDKIFLPETGLRVIQASYGDEASEALLVEQRLDDEDRALLKKLPIPGGHLLDAHKARMTAAKRLGVLDDKRKALESKLEEKETIKQADVLKARNGWIQAARALVTVIDLAQPSVAVRQRILGPLEAAEKKAGRRGGAKAPTEDAAGDEGGNGKEGGEGVEE